MAREMAASLIVDINEALVSFAKKSNGKPFYLMVHEKKDLQMKDAILRRILYFDFRPWPEDDTTVYWKNPKTDELRFCWCLPHSTDMENVLNNPDQYSKEYVDDIRAWKAFDMKHFGFYNDSRLKWIPNPKHRDRDPAKYRPNISSQD